MQISVNTCTKTEVFLSVFVQKCSSVNGALNSMTPKGRRLKEKGLIRDRNLFTNEIMKIGVVALSFLHPMFSKAL